MARADSRTPAATEAHGPRPAADAATPPPGRAERLRALTATPLPRPTAKRALDLALGSALLILAAPCSPQPP